MMKQFDMDINEIHNKYLLVLLKEQIVISEELKIRHKYLSRINIKKIT